MVEVRIPTFRRPELLERALDSLVTQERVEWRAVILDDDPEGSAEDLVRGHQAGSRLRYQRNPRRLGIARNISAAFRPEPFFEDTKFACVLEDDNFYRPALLSRNIEELDESGQNLLLRNACVYDFVGGENRGPIGDTLGPTLGQKRRCVPYRERLLRSFYQTPISNLGLFWRLGLSLDLSCREEEYNSLTSEKLRGLHDKGDLLYLPEPLSVHAHFSGRAYGEEKTAVENRLFWLGGIRFDRLLWQDFSDRERSDVIREMQAAGREVELYARLAQAGFRGGILRQRGGGLWKVLKASLFRLHYARKLQPLPRLPHLAENP